MTAHASERQPEPPEWQTVSPTAQELTIGTFTAQMIIGDDHEQSTAADVRITPPYTVMGVGESTRDGIDEFYRGVFDEKCFLESQVVTPCATELKVFVADPDGHISVEKRVDCISESIAWLVGRLSEINDSTGQWAQFKQ